MRFHRRSLFALLALVSVPLLAVKCSNVVIQLPLEGQLSSTGSVTVQVKLPPTAVAGTAVIELDGADVTAQLTIVGRDVSGQIAVPTDGDHVLRVQATTNLGIADNDRRFRTTTLVNASECEILNAAECLLPYPSTRFHEADATKPNGVRVSLPAVGMPAVNGPPVDPSPSLLLDGSSPTTAILMHLPTPLGVDLAASGADILIAPDPQNPQSKPYSGLRTQGGGSIQAGSPTLLIRASTGEPALHWVEMDSRSAGAPARQTLVLRPAQALEPGERYIVAIRNVVDTAGSTIPAESVFATLRDLLPTTIAELESRRQYFEDEIFTPLASATVPVTRSELQLAFDFRVQSDAGLTAQVISMRDQAFAWLANEVDLLGQQTFTVNPFAVDPNNPNPGESVEWNCAVPATPTWRILRGTYEVPLYLTADITPPNINSVGVLNVDVNGLPVQNGVTDANFTISIPCAAKLGGVPADHAMILGHGLFGNGDGMVNSFGDFFGGNYAAAATDWRGLSSFDVAWVGVFVIGIGNSMLNNFPSFVDRLKQGQINTLVLARMMKRGDFNVDPAFQVAAATDGLPGPSDEMFYLGVSLGGIMGTYFAALTPDVERFNIDVPAINFSTLLQRSTQFSSFESLLSGIGLTDPMQVLLGLAIQHDLWSRGEPAGYVHLLADQVALNQKKMLMTVAWLDKQVSNQASEVLARTLGITNDEGSVLQGMVNIPDGAGPHDSALVIYDTGSFDIYNPAHEPLFPSLANQIPSNVCDPHARRLLIPASQSQVLAFLQPGGQISNFCTGACDGDPLDPNELPNGGPACDPLNP